jgi:hypothetical protein
VDFRGKFGELNMTTMDVETWIRAPILNVYAMQMDVETWIRAPAILNVYAMQVAFVSLAPPWLLSRCLETMRKGIIAVAWKTHLRKKKKKKSQLH